MRLLSSVQPLFLLMHLHSSTSFFKHWTSPFKETLMSLRQTKKTRHRDSYALLPLQTLNTLKLVLSSYCQTIHVLEKKHRAKLGITPKLVHFQICVSCCFSFVNSSPCVSDNALCFPQTHGTHLGLFVDSSFVYV